MLHIVNGDSFGNKLKQLDLGGDILVWREALYEGPLSVTLTDENTRQLRANYLHSCFGVPPDVYIANCLQQEQQLADFRDHDEIVLWFEHDLFDQTMLIYLLQWFAGRDLGSTRLNLLCLGEFPGIEHFTGLGQLNVEQIATLWGAWEQVSQAQLLLAEQAWRAYTSPDPQLVEEMWLRHDMSSLPFLKDAFSCHLARFPSSENGLDQVEQITLELLKDGEYKLIVLFQEVSRQISQYGLGDSQFWNYLNRLRACKHPLIFISGPPQLPNAMTAEPPNFDLWTVSLTEVGQRTLHCSEDHILLNGMDRWLGGVHMLGNQSIWRWDGGLGKLIRR